MELKYIVWECENCGKKFYREVVETITDDADLVSAKVAVLKDSEGQDEEFPMCACLGGNAEHTVA